MPDTVPATTDTTPQPDPAALQADIRAFGGQDISRATARRLLQLWHGYFDLTPATVNAVLEPFPPPVTPVVGPRGHAAWCTGHHRGPCTPAGAS